MSVYAPLWNLWIPACWIKPYHGMAWDQSSSINEESESGDSITLKGALFYDPHGSQNNLGNNEAEGRG